jgi:hypothetical protein
LERSIIPGQPLTLEQVSEANEIDYIHTICMLKAEKNCCKFKLGWWNSLMSLLVPARMPWTFGTQPFDADVGSKLAPNSGNARKTKPKSRKTSVSSLWKTFTSDSQQQK